MESPLDSGISLNLFVGMPYRFAGKNISKMLSIWHERIFADEI